MPANWRHGKLSELDGRSGCRASKAAIGSQTALVFRPVSGRFCNRLLELVALLAALFCLHDRSRGERFFPRLAVLGQSFQLSLHSACRTATFSINLSIALSRSAASSSMLSESRSIFAMQAPVSLWLPGRCIGHKDGAGLIHRERRTRGANTHPL